MADFLEAGKKAAMEMMLQTSVGAEMDIAKVEDQKTWLGFGWMVGKGWLAYRSGGCFKFIGAGRRDAQNYLNQ